jgi:hypothetical protein
MWSKFKKFVKKVWRIVKAASRFAVRTTIFVLTLPFKAWDAVFGFLAWPPKRMKVHIAVLRGPGGPLVSHADLNDLLPSIELLKKVYKDNCNITVSPYSSGNEREIDNWAQILSDVAPAAALGTGPCSIGTTLNEQETGEAGDYFRKHVAGWVGGIPISLSFPVTVFIVNSIGPVTPDRPSGSSLGCTIPFLADYVLVTVGSLKPEPVVIAHEIGHRCNILPEHTDPKNLMFSGGTTQPPHGLKGWQENLVRSSRHVTYAYLF